MKVTAGWLPPYAKEFPDAGAILSHETEVLASSCAVQFNVPDPVFTTAEDCADGETTGDPATAVKVIAVADSTRAVTELFTCNVTVASISCPPLSTASVSV